MDILKIALLEMLVAKQTFNKTKIYIILIIVLYTNALLGQKPNFQSGVYYSLEQFRLGIPEKAINFNIEKRSGSDITMNGGNEFKLVSDADSIKKKAIKKKVFAYVKNDSILINGYHHGLQTWYGLALTRGNYLLFKGCIRNEDAFAVGLMGGMIGSAIAAKTSYLYILSLRTGNVNYCSIEYLQKRIEENKIELLSQFKVESEGLKNQELEPIAIKYLNMLNEFVSPLQVNN